MLKYVTKKSALSNLRICSVLRSEKKMSSFTVILALTILSLTFAGEWKMFYDNLLKLYYIF